MLPVNNLNQIKQHTQIKCAGFYLKTSFISMLIKAGGEIFVWVKKKSKKNKKL